MYLVTLGLKTLQIFYIIYVYDVWKRSRWLSRRNLFYTPSQKNSNLKCFIKEVKWRPVAQHTVPSDTSRCDEIHKHSQSNQSRGSFTAQRGQTSELLSLLKSCPRIFSDQTVRLLRIVENTRKSGNTTQMFRRWFELMIKHKDQFESVTHWLPSCQSDILLKFGCRKSSGWNSVEQSLDHFSFFELSWTCLWGRNQKRLKQIPVSLLRCFIVPALFCLIVYLYLELKTLKPSIMRGNISILVLLSKTGLDMRPRFNNWLHQIFIRSSSGENKSSSSKLHVSCHQSGALINTGAVRKVS